MQKTNEIFYHVREHIQQEMIEHSMPSLSIAIAQGKTILWEEGFGWANRENRTPATPHTMYSLASISKPITATALMILKERELLHLDQPINNYLGEEKIRARVGNVEDATVRRIANHTSGLPHHYQFFYQDEPYQRPGMSETIRRYGNLVTAPGERYQYSNLGYGILGGVIARLSGKSYADFLREEVFLPLGMVRASVNIEPGLEAFQAIRYGSDGIAYPFYDNDVQFKGQYLTGKMMGNINTPDASRRPHHLHLDLKHREDVLNGAIIAITSEDRGGGAPEKRKGNALSYWTELRKEE